MKQVYRELKKPEVKERFKAVVVDTIDVASDRCKKYICQQNDIEELGDLGYGRGWTKFKDEFNEVFRGLTQLGYAVIFLGHHKEVTLTDESTNTEKMVIRPSLSNSTREVIAGMSDIYAYAHQASKDKMSRLTLRDPSGRVECGCRFKYIPNEIELSYGNLVEAIQEAIEEEAKETNGKFVTDEKIVPPEAKKMEYNFTELRKEFTDIVSKLIEEKGPEFAPKITYVVEKYLGKGKKVTDTTEKQAEFIYLINSEIKDEYLN